MHACMYYMVRVPFLSFEETFNADMLFHQMQHAACYIAIDQQQSSVVCIVITGLMGVYIAGNCGVTCAQVGGIYA